MAHPADYLPEARKAARAELDRRQISEEKFEETVQSLREERKLERQIARKGLSTGEKLLFLFVPILGFAGWAFFQLKYHNRGEKRKMDQATVYMVGGILLWAILIYMMMRV